VEVGQELPSVHLGEHHVQHDHVRGSAVDQVEDLRFGDGGYDLIARPCGVTVEEVNQILIVVDDQDAGHRDGRDLHGDGDVPVLRHDLHAAILGQGHHLLNELAVGLDAG